MFARSAAPLVVLGIDPGLTRCGYACLHATGPQRVTPVAMGVLTTPPTDPLPTRLAELRGTLPPVVAAVGAEPDRVEMSAILTPELEAVVDAVAEKAAHRLEAWGHHVKKRPAYSHA